MIPYARSMSLAVVVVVVGALVGGVTAAKWSWAVRWVKFTMEQQVLLEDKHGGCASVLLCVQLPLTAAHGSDEGGPLTAAILG